MRQGVVLVAERFNQPAMVHRSQEYWHRDGGVRWLSTARRMGCFRKGRGMRRLHSLGVSWHESLNLTPPAPQGVSFDVSLADQVASMVRDMPWWRIVCVGRRAARAFGIDFAPRWGTLYAGRFIVVPHPSGLNHYWNATIDVQLVTREMVLRALSLDADRRCEMCHHPLWPSDPRLCPECAMRRLS